MHQSDGSQPSDPPLRYCDYSRTNRGGGVPWIVSPDQGTGGTAPVHLERRVREVVSSSLTPTEQSWSATRAGFVKPPVATWLQNEERLWMLMLEVAPLHQRTALLLSICKLVMFRL